MLGYKANTDIERKKYICEVFAKSYPVVREERYGFTNYDKSICHYICQLVPQGSKLLEVAIGNGYPVADFLLESGYVIHGIDISPYLVDKCRELNPDIKCKVGDSENLEYPDDYFDATYCLLSTWYFTNLNRSIDEMIRVTRPKGLVIFDIQNRSNRGIKTTYERRISTTKGLKRAIALFLNLAAIGKRFLLRQSMLSALPWHFILHPVVYEVPTWPESVYQHLNERGINTYQVLFMKDDGNIELGDERDSFEDFIRLIFVIEKQPFSTTGDQS